MILRLNNLANYTTQIIIDMTTRHYAFFFLFTSFLTFANSILLSCLFAFFFFFSFYLYFYLMYQQFYGIININRGWTLIFHQTKLYAQIPFVKTSYLFLITCELQPPMRAYALAQNKTKI
jgi:hypothetical protein